MLIGWMRSPSAFVAACPGCCGHPDDVIYLCYLCSPFASYPALLYFVKIPGLMGRHQANHEESSRSFRRRVRVAVRKIAALPIWIYRRAISPVVPARCIYQPSCSQYTYDGILRHGVFKGLILGIGRITRCIGGVFVGGEDPVPETVSVKEILANYRRFHHKNDSNRLR